MASLWRSRRIREFYNGAVGFGGLRRLRHRRIDEHLGFRTQVFTSIVLGLIALQVMFTGGMLTSLGL